MSATWIYCAKQIKAKHENSLLIIMNECITIKQIKLK